MPDRKHPFYLSIIAFICVAALMGLVFFSFKNLDYEWDFSFIKDYFWEPEENKPGLLLQGLWTTIYVSLISIIVGSLFGVIVGALLLSKEKVSRFAAYCYVDIFRNTPVLVQLYVAFFVVGTAFELTAMQSGIATLGMFCAAYVADIFRGTIANFDKGQLDAAKSLGLNPFQIGMRIVAPQALRRMLPPLVGLFVTLVKDSSLISVIGIMDLTKASLNIVSVTFKSFETWFVVALLYLFVNLILSGYGRYLERKLSVSL